jgi:hypothetical protein
MSEQLAEFAIEQTEFPDAAVNEAKRNNGRLAAPQYPPAPCQQHWIVMGLHPNLEDAMKIAARESIDLPPTR